MLLNRFLKIAVLAGVESAIKIHVDRGDDLNARDRDGLTLLMLAASRNNAAMCKLLLNAGVDKDLSAPSGKTAHSIAVDAGAHEAVAELESAISQHKVASIAEHPAHPQGESKRIRLDEKTEASLIDLVDMMNADGDSFASPNAVDEFSQPDETSGAEDIVFVELEPSLDKAAGEKDDVSLLLDTEGSREVESTSDFDLFGWEPEEEASAPALDPILTQAAGALQVFISGYAPIDSSEEWEDLDLYLPEKSVPLIRAVDGEARELLRLLLLRAVREGSVPSASLDELTQNDDRSRNFEAESLLTMVINDLGAEVDERHEYVNRDENFTVHVSPQENLEEDEIVSGALALLDNISMRHNEPLRLYQKEFQREKLISAEDEVTLGKTMENELERALDALAAWPQGIALTIAAGEAIKSKQKPLSWLSLGPAEAQLEAEAALSIEGEADFEVPNSADTEVDEESSIEAVASIGDFDCEFFDALTRLASLPFDLAGRGAAWQSIRETLSALRLNRRFLLDLADTDRNTSDATAAYIEAMSAYQSARERMTAANLKLVFHHAKKYLYSGEPLDDLAQEGNLGLLKAVERYDWRRGFKFSTYATWWIRQHIGRYVADKGRTIRVPVHIYAKIQLLTREIETLEAELGRPPKIEEIAARAEMPTHRVAGLQRLSLDPLQLHELPLDELIAYDARPDLIPSDPFDTALRSGTEREVANILATLKPKEEKVIRLRYGIGISDSLTLEDVGQRFSVTRERIRQIEAKTMQKLSHPSRLDALSQIYFGHPGVRIVSGKGILADGAKVEESPHSQPQRQPSRKNRNLAPAAKVPAVERLLKEAEELGVATVDERQDPTGKIWIRLLGTPDAPHRKLARKLIAFGFEFVPMKGYWK